MRDKDGQGLEEVYRLDFAESGRGYSLWRNGVVPGEIDFINFYGSDLWVTTQKHLHRIDVATGKVLERRDETRTQDVYPGDTRIFLVRKLLYHI